VRSGGPDGQFDTDDDLGIVIYQCDDESWDQERQAWFLRKDGESMAVLFHRWSGGHFEYNNEAGAADMTGGKLFDLFKEDQLSSGAADSQLAMVEAAYAGFAAAADHDPVVLQVFSYGTPP